MNTDIRLSVDFFDHPKTIKLQRRLGLEGVHCLLRLWLFAAKHKVSGELADMDEEEIAIAAKWPNDPSTFVTTLVEIRWMDKGDCYALHDWVDHNGYASCATDRSDKSRFSRMAKTHKPLYDALKLQGYEAISAEEYKKITAPNRVKTKVPSNEDVTNVERTLNDSLTNTLSPLPSPLPLPSPDIKPLSATADVALEILLNDESLFPLSLEDVKDWTNLFPNIDVVDTLAQIQKACEKSPSKRKDKDGIRAHIVGCLKMMNDRRETFERIWKRYPCKDGKKEAERHFRATVHTEDDLRDIHQALDKYLAMLENNPTRPPKNGSTWFNNWQDWVNWEEPLNGRSTATGSAAHPRAEKGKPAGPVIDGTPKPAGYYAGDFPDRSDEW